MMDENTKNFAKRKLQRINDKIHSLEFLIGVTGRLLAGPEAPKQSWYLVAKSRAESLKEQLAALQCEREKLIQQEGVI